MRSRSPFSLLHSRVLLALALSVALCTLASVIQGHPGHETEPSPADTEVVAVIFLDFYSPACGEVNALLDALASARHLRIQKLFKHTPSHPDALPAHEAALAAGAQGKFLEMQDLLFKQSKPAGTLLLNSARTLGLDLKRFETALDDREFRHIVIRDLAEARGLGVKTAPTVFLSGTKVEGLEALRSLLKAPARPPQPSWESTPVETLALDFKGSPSDGPSDAPITLVEFTDFRCGFCRIHSQVLSELMTLYPGKIYRVFKHYPIDLSAAALQPHLGSLAAWEQGKFWALHHSLMEHPLGSAPELLERLPGLGLETARFEKEILAPEKLALIQRDIQEGETLNIRATPTTFLNGRRLVGRQSLESLKKFVDEILARRVPQPGRGAAVSTVQGETKETLASFGPSTASVRFEIFLDLGDRESAPLLSQMKALAAMHPEFRIDFRHFPQASSPAARRRHEAVMAAFEQGRFWEMSERVLQSGLSASVTEETEILKAHARALSLDPVRFETSLGAAGQKGSIQIDFEEGQQRGLTKSGLFINDTFYQGAFTVKDLTAYLQQSNCCGRTLVR